jgi:hypothetical protein
MTSDDCHHFINHGRVDATVQIEEDSCYITATAMLHHDRTKGNSQADEKKIQQIDESK